MIDLNPNHLATVQRILAEHVPECEVRAFGSRATWTAKDYSDIDLAIVGEGAVGMESTRPSEGGFRRVEPAHASGRARLARHIR